jgi:hypothetical protein
MQPRFHPYLVDVLLWSVQAWIGNYSWKCILDVFSAIGKTVIEIKRVPVQIDDSELENRLRRGNRIQIITCIVDFRLCTSWR